MGEVSFHSAVIPVIQIEIWERGAGYTLATDSSSMAVAGVALKLGLCDADITVHMPGGSLNIQFRNGFRACGSVHLATRRDGTRCGAHQR